MLVSTPQMSDPLSPAGLGFSLPWRKIPPSQCSATTCLFPWLSARKIVLRFLFPPFIWFKNVEQILFSPGGTFTLAADLFNLLLPCNGDGDIPPPLRAGRMRPPSFVNRANATPFARADLNRRPLGYALSPPFRRAEWAFPS